MPTLLSRSTRCHEPLKPFNVLPSLWVCIYCYSRISKVEPKKDCFGRSRQEPFNKPFWALNPRRPKPGLHTERPEAPWNRCSRLHEAHQANLVYAFLDILRHLLPWIHQRLLAYKMIFVDLHLKMQQTSILACLAAQGLDRRDVISTPRAA